MAQSTVEQTEIAVPTHANPAPLGLCGFALTTFVLSAFNAGLFTNAQIVIGLAIFYGGLGQLLAGMWEFRSGNTFGALAFSSYGCFWLATGWALQHNQLLNDGFGYFLAGWALFTFIGLLGTLRTNLALISVFSFLTLTFIVLAISAFAGSHTWLHISGHTWLHIGGWLGIITALLAWYTATAGMLNSAKSAFTLPTFPVS